MQRISAEFSAIQQFKETTHEQIGLQIPVVRFDVVIVVRVLFGAINTEQDGQRQ